MELSREIFRQYYGEGPFACHHCGLPIEGFWEKQVKRTGDSPILHHADGNHGNNDPRNLAPVHVRCHNQIHHQGVSRSRATPEPTWEGDYVP